MTDFIADNLYMLKAAKVPRKSDGIDPDDLHYLGGMQAVARRLEERELYAFDVSAIRAAADLRIDTPDRVDRLVTAVFSEPRKLFIEVDVEARDNAMRGLRGFFGHLQEGREPAKRFGVFVDILGGGKAIVQPIWMHGREVARTNKALKEKSSLFRSYPTSVHSALSRALTLSMSPSYGFMDISRHVGMARSEFDMVFQRAKPGFDPLLDKARKKVSSLEGVRAQGRAKDDFWRMMRFRDVVSKFDDDTLSLGVMGRLIQGLYPNEMFDPTEIGLHVVAMCAVLQADSEDIKSAPRSRSSSPASTGRSAARKGDAKMAPGMSVVTLNILDHELRELYEKGGGSESGHTSTAGGSGGRVRHPVRGHLFLARNGKMVWRKPHWRGSLEGGTLKRVVAPSYRLPT